MPGNDSNFLDESRKFHVPVMHAYQHDEQIRDSIGESGLMQSRCLIVMPLPSNKPQQRL